jgi:hypothetical protein
MHIISLAVLIWYQGHARFDLGGTESEIFLCATSPAAEAFVAAVLSAECVIHQQRVTRNLPEKGHSVVKCHSHHGTSKSAAQSENCHLIGLNLPITILQRPVSGA